jgi:acetolactate synthase small subunit
MEHVYFFELSGEGARERLEQLKQKLEHLPSVHSIKLLKNTKQTDLFLLVVEASEEPHIEVPGGIRVWTFERVDADAKAESKG